jgi:hypothetical protein
MKRFSGQSLAADLQRSHFPLDVNAEVRCIRQSMLIAGSQDDAAIIEISTIKAL